MSERLVDSIVDRIREKEAQKINEKARADADYAGRLEQSLADAALIKQRADTVHRLLIERDSAWRNRGLLRRLLFGDKRPTDWYLEHFEADFATPRENYLRDLISDKPAYREIAELTFPFGLERQHREELTFQVGWQVAAVKEREVQNPDDTVESTFDLKSKPLPVRIWHYAREEASGEHERQLAYDVSRVDGEVQSYTEGKLDDRYVAISKQAGAHVLAILNQAIELIK